MRCVVNIGTHRVLQDRATAEETVVNADAAREEVRIRETVPGGRADNTNGAATAGRAEGGFEWKSRGTLVE